MTTWVLDKLLIFVWSDISLLSPAETALHNSRIHFPADLMGGAFTLYVTEDLVNGGFMFEHWLFAQCCIAFTRPGGAAQLWRNAAACNV